MKITFIYKVLNIAHYKQWKKIKVCRSRPSWSWGKQHLIWFKEKANQNWNFRSVLFLKNPKWVDTSTKSYCSFPVKQISKDFKNDIENLVSQAILRLCIKTTLTLFGNILSNSSIEVSECFFFFVFVFVFVFFLFCFVCLFVFCCCLLFFCCCCTWVLFCSVFLSFVLFCFVLFCLVLVFCFFVLFVCFLVYFCVFFFVAIIVGKILANYEHSWIVFNNHLFHSFSFIHQTLLP